MALVQILSTSLKHLLLDPRDQLAPKVLPEPTVQTVLPDQQVPRVRLALLEPMVLTELMEPRDQQAR